VYVLRYDRMMSSFGEVMEEVMDFVGHQPSAKLRETIRNQAQAQKAYRSRHKYDLQRFGLDEVRIRSDCDFFYEAFLRPCARQDAVA
jgi:hypothetical protein